MGFAGLKDDKDRASVILYLNENPSIHFVINFPKQNKRIAFEREFIYSLFPNL